jgi:hypothetical protein
MLNFWQRGAIIRQPSTDRLWGMREIATATPDGHRLMIAHKFNPPAPKRSELSRPMHGLLRPASGFSPWAKKYEHRIASAASGPPEPVATPCPRRPFHRAHGAILPFAHGSSRNRRRLWVDPRFLLHRPGSRFVAGELPATSGAGNCIPACGERLRASRDIPLGWPIVSRGPKVRGLTAGGRWIRTSGSARS